MELLDQVDCRVLDLIKAKWFVNLLERTREAERNK
jgi:hypothetical protein